ncbi:calcium and integrin-binding protein 1-like [Polistes fuscatus]|uniref:calcium and integrin-binding protein 1-like n=1 Tax=Polistes fuscatus TaxID=30207 RepID=UPI001CA8212B|nr:calcium and integrin-binding protein 1-like [Polistes fuscatus]
MGNSNSNHTLSEELIEDYVELSYLTKFEILHIFDLLDNLAPGTLCNNLHHRFTKKQIDKILPQVLHSPFRDSIYRVFSSEQDECLSFEDVLDLCSAFSRNCPLNVRSAWAFLIFDFDGDDQLVMADLIEAVEKLTSINENEEIKIQLNRERIEQVARMMISEMDFTENGSISPQEFERLVARMPDFAHSFQFNV